MSRAAESLRLHPFPPHGSSPLVSSSQLFAQHMLPTLSYTPSLQSKTRHLESTIDEPRARGVVIAQLGGSCSQLILHHATVTSERSAKYEEQDAAPAPLTQGSGSLPDRGSVLHQTHR